MRIVAKAIAGFARADPAVVQASHPCFIHCRRTIAAALTVEDTLMDDGEHNGRGQRHEQKPAGQQVVTPGHHSKRDRTQGDEHPPVADREVSAFIARGYGAARVQALGVFEAGIHETKLSVVSYQFLVTKGGSGARN
jgi:hypothetical protein